MIVLDTHAWIWWVSNPSLLSEAANRLIDEAAAARGIYLSSISAWEVAVLVARGRLQLTINVGDWITASAALPSVHFVPVDNGIAVQSVLLPGNLHNDPADRIIIATAISRDAVLITKDQKLRAYPHVRTAW